MNEQAKPPIDLTPYIKDYRTMVQTIINVTIEGLAKGYHGPKGTPQQGIEMFQHICMDCTDWLMARLRGPKSVAHVVVTMGSAVGLQLYMAGKLGMPLQPNAAKEAGKLFAAAMEMALEAAKASSEKSPLIKA